MKREWILEAENLCYTYEDSEEPALCGVDLKIARGEKVAVLGANGSGKSTFFLCLNGILKPRTGNLKIDGQRVDYSRKGLQALRKKVGIVFQDPDSQLFCASVYQDISFGILNLGVPEREARKEVEQVIRELGITPFQHRPVHALSGGQKKMVSIADILVMHPEMIILDEPASSLDSKHVKQVRRVVESMSGQGITVIIATHDMEYAYGWADRMVLMHEGRVLKEGTPQAVCADREALCKVNQKEPEALQLYRLLRESKKLDPTLSPPRDMEELKNYIRQEKPVSYLDRDKRKKGKEKERER